MLEVIGIAVGIAATLWGVYMNSPSWQSYVSKKENARKQQRAFARLKSIPYNRVGTVIKKAVLNSAGGLETIFELCVITYFTPERITVREIHDLCLMTSMSPVEYEALIVTTDTMLTSEYSGEHLTQEMV